MWIALPLSAQNKNQPDKGGDVKSDSVALFRGMALTADLVGPILHAVSDYGQYEGSLRLNLRDKFFVALEIGYGQADTENVATSICYKTAAPYYKIGCDFNLMKNKHDDYRFFAGVRYAFTSYRYDMWGKNQVDPVWGDEVLYEARDVKASCNWLEGLLGVDAKIAGPLRMGWTVRYRRRVSHQNGEPGNVWYVPGYGKQGKTRLGVTFNVGINLWK